ncbi:DUF2690 domain-containing protein [Thermogemmatispora tikiterensis]|uniref:DUF2690 domain-containing protein n=1 Tax=Thermogemmatispora tikiterensis TaxID=1825093 RepID=A0A328VG75_9CHLR|nr:DUF2690 domain-containing protein [Thermogemmatispora tikiterensis]RAQ95841.1 hypothetical protein A4R35_09860 [Thermogemmatispora tikiterensis]
MYRLPALLTDPRQHRWLLWARKARGCYWLLVLILLALLIVSLLLWPTPPGLARGNSFETCSTVLPQDRPRFCTGTDPIVEGCSLDARTVSDVPMRWGTRTVGLAQVRHSLLCNTYWGRGFRFLPGASISVYLPDLGTGAEASYLSTTSQVYSNMVYAFIPTVTIEIIVGPTQVIATTIPGVHPIGTAG